ncbi:MAG TPA: ABC transporter permease [Jatrophihabitans sp.]|jgi:D-xylose transport system permease protein|uniref:sugar ABC transporter permease n=1 Tax=Jatrophihabitans sp. TaxID=1932789 RepID=UPI002EED856E
MTTGTSSATAAPPDPDESQDANSLAVLASTAPVGNNIGDYTRNYLSRLRGGDMGSLPAITGLVALIILFSILQPSFASLYNTAVLLTEGSGPIVIAMGLVFVLLLGEIDLSAGYAAGVCAAVMVRVMVGYNAPWPVSIGLALLTGIVIGTLIGLLRAKLRIPSFVVTLAFFLAFQGVALYILNNGKGQQGNVSVTDNVVNSINNGQMPLWAGWLFAVLCVLLYAGVKLSGSRSRRRAGLSAEPTSVLGLKIAGLAVLVFGMVYVLNQNRAIVKTASIENVNGRLVRVPPPRLEGVPWVIPLVVTLLVIGTFVLTRTRYGRHVYAVGGNEEAARRAGVPVDRIRISVFVISSFMAAIGGILIASNVKSVSVDNYGGNTLLLAVGAAVIGGTSLFGGKGRVIDAIIGGLVVEVIYNGMADLVRGTNGSAVQYVVTGLVLMLAAAIDALSRRRAGAAGLG